MPARANQTGRGAPGRLAPFIIVGSVAVLTFASTIVLYRTSQRPLLTIPEGTAKSGEKVHRLGRADSPITVDEFGDFQCPPCGLLAGPIDQLEPAYRPRVAVVFHELPLENHAHAREAAYAAEAAGLQNRFWEMHDLLYREQGVWSVAQDTPRLLTSYARILRLDVERFQKDMRGEEVRGRVEADKKEAALLGVTKTPTVFINKRQVSPGALTPEGLRKAVEEVLKAKGAH